MTMDIDIYAPAMPCFTMPPWPSWTFEIKLDSTMRGISAIVVGTIQRPPNGLLADLRSRADHREISQITERRGRSGWPSAGGEVLRGTLSCCIDGHCDKHKGRPPSSRSTTEQDGNFRDTLQSGLI